MNKFIIFLLCIITMGCNKNTPSATSTTSSASTASSDNNSQTVASLSNSELEIAVKSIEKNIEEAYQPNLLISLRDFEKRFSVFSTERGKNEAARLEALINEKLAKFNYVDESVTSTKNNEDTQNLSLSQLKQFKVDLAKCSGNSLLTIASIESQILTFGSDINNDKAIKFNSAMNMLYSEIGKSINGDDYERVAQELYDSKIENFGNQKISLGVAQAKENIINDMMANVRRCIVLLQDSKNATYVASVIGLEKMKVYGEFINKQALLK